MNDNRTHILIQHEHLISKTLYDLVKCILGLQRPYIILDLITSTNI